MTTDQRADVKCDCGKMLRHRRVYCPLFPEVEPPTAIDHEHYRATGQMRRVPGEKWGECVCFIHTHSSFPIGARQ